jgi:arabinofuranan 3-O-arabinosyltransferase
MTLSSIAPADVSAPRPARRNRGISDRWWFLLVWVAALLIFTSFDRGQIAFDTKLGVDLNAARFLTRLWPLWDPLAWFGTLQNQYIGYAIPMAPFYLVGQLARVPVWVIERVWLSVLVTLAFAGLVRLAAALRIGSPGSRLLAGAAYALWPTFTIAMGSTSEAALPGIMMPWAVLPLIPALRGTSGVARAAARSGVAIALMGGVNAASTLAALLLPALYILTGAAPGTGGAGNMRPPPGRRFRLAATWSAAVLAATAWWLVPLLLQGRYSFNFLPYIEQSDTTAKTMSADAMLRGSGTWTAYLNLAGAPWIRSGWVMVTSAAPVLASAAVAATGLGGLARRDMPERRWLTISVGVTALIALAAYYGPLSGPFSGQALRLFNGALAPLRSTYKFEPVVAAAMTLGCAHVLGRLRSRLPGRIRDTHRVYAGVSVALVALVLGGLALPQLTGQMWQGSFAGIPSYWDQAASYLAAHSPRQTALMVPSDPHAEFLWGNTSDNPLETLASSPWVERGIVPYGGAGSQQLLETIESAIESGQEVPGLAAYLARAGIRYVVVRNDLSLNMFGYVQPQVANETLAQSGFQRVAAFGPLVPSAPVYPQAAGAVAGYAASYPAVEIFQAVDPAMRSPGPVSALPASSATLVNGGTDSLLQLGAQGLLNVGTPAVLSGDPVPGVPKTWAVTDGQRRADSEFGVTSDYVSYTYTATGRNPSEDPLGSGGQPPRQLLPVTAAGHQTVAVLSGAASVTASSAGTWLTESQQADPVNAFDGDSSTAWTEADPSTPVGQWIQISFGHSVEIGSRIGIRMLDDSPYRALATELTVTTAAGSVSTAMAPSGNLQSLRVRPGTSSWLRITITRAANSTPGGPGAGITDVLIPGITVTKYLQPAEDTVGAVVSYSFQLQAEETHLARTFTTPAKEVLGAEMTAQPVAGPALSALIARLTPVPEGTFQAVASSSWSGLPEFGADGVFTGSAPWIAAASDPDPTITVRWHGMRTISTLQLTGASGQAAVPFSVVVKTPYGTQVGRVDSDGVVRLVRPVRTDQLALSFPAYTHAATAGTGWQPAQLPVGLAKVVIPGLRGLRVSVPQSSTAFHLACGAGPRVVADGVTYQTSVSGTLGALATLRPVALQLCGSGGHVTLSAGRHYLVAGQSGTFTLTGLTLRSPAAAAAVSAAAAAGSAGAAAGSAGAAQRQVGVLSWAPDNRVVNIGPGASAYVEIHENFNTGWVATMNGRRLTPVVLDGWQQGFIVPAGAGGVIDLGYAPARTYHFGVAVSAAMLLGLLLFALAIRPGRRGRPALAGPPGSPLPVAGNVSRVGQRMPRLAVLVPLATVILAVGGFTVIAVPVLAIVAGWRPRWLTWIAAASMFGSGITAAATSHPTVLGDGAFSALAQGLALVALSAALMPYLEPYRSRTRSTGFRSVTATPFSMVDELNCYYDTPDEPNNIHVEMYVPGRVSEDAFRTAVGKALADFPRARARRIRIRTRFWWQADPDLRGEDLVSHVTWETEEELNRHRTAFVSRAPSLDSAGTVRLLLASGPARSCIMLNAHHAALDGLSCLDLLRSVACAYDGPQTGTEAGGGTHTAGAAAGPRPPRPPRPPEAAARKPHSRWPVNRIAAEPSPDRAGHGIHVLPPMPVPTARTGTVNDVLVTALITAIGRWNTAHRRPSGNIRVTIPVNARTPGLPYQAGNHTRLAAVTARWRGSTGAILASVSRQTRWVKDHPRPPVDPVCRILAAAPLPPVIKRATLRLILRSAGRLFCDTTMLSNLGNVGSPPRFGDLPVDRILISAPAHMPRGLAVCAISLGGELHLCVRHQRALLTDDAAVRFADLLTEALAQLS